MASILTHAIIASATEKVDNYVASANGLFEELNGLVSAVTSTHFVGDASTGYKAFFDDKVVPALTQNLTEPGSSIMASIKSMLESIQAQLLDMVDPQLGDNNRNPGTGTEG